MDNPATTSSTTSRDSTGPPFSLKDFSDLKGMPESDRKKAISYLKMRIDFKTEKETERLKTFDM
jgi:hypothetical protein